MLLSRLLLYAAAWGVHCLMQGRAVSFAASFDGLWVHWDARHYLKIAQQGYVNVGDDRLILVFFPLYPWCVRALNLLLGDWVVSSVIVSNLCAAGAASLLYALVHRVYDAQTARLSLCYFLLNPYSVFLAAPYSEALFLLLTLGALYAAANDRCWLRRCSARFPRSRARWASSSAGSSGCMPGARPCARARGRGWPSPCVAR